jgi:CheY-like chemotaxis protein
MNANPRILHVDDDPQMTRLVAQLLNSRGYEVTSINDSCAAMEAVARDHYPVVILDIDMPVTSGLDLLKSIKTYDGGIQVVMLTGVVTQASVLQSLRWGAEACVFKPIDDLAPLLKALETAFEKLERWWLGLRQLAARRQAVKCITPTSVLT